MAFVNPCVPPEVLESMRQRLDAAFANVFAKAVEYYPRRLGEFREALEAEGFDPDQSASLTEVLFDHLLAATLGSNRT